MSDRPSDADIVAQVARAHEVDRYLAALLSPREVRADLVALAAFAGEVARIPVMVSEPMIGEIRLQWWRDALEAGRCGVRSGNPVADAFAGVIARHDLPMGLVGRFIDAQVPLVHSERARDEAALRADLAGSDGVLFSLAARLLDASAAVAHAAWIDRAGVAYGLARAALEYSAVRAQGRSVVPIAVEREGASDPDVKGLVWLCAAAERDIAALARDRAPPRPVELACLPVAMVGSYCRRVRRLGERALAEPVDVLPLARVWRLFRASRGRLF